MREFVVRSAEPSDIAIQGGVSALGLRPQKVAAAETYCRRCDAPAVWPKRVLGRWDEERQRTAMPFDPVAVLTSCGCWHGDRAAAGPMGEA